MNRIVAMTSRFVSAEPADGRDYASYGSPPVGKAFVGFTAAMAVTCLLAVFESRTDFTVSDTTASQFGMVGTTVFVTAGLAAAYRAFTTRTPTLAPIVALLLGPGAFWCWLTVVWGTGAGAFTTVVTTSASLIGAILLLEGLWRARWLGVFCGLGAVGIAVAARLIQSVPETRSTIAFALLLAIAGMACLYGTLVEIESAGRHSFEELLDAKRKIEDEIAQTEDVLHDLRTGLLSIETAMASLDGDVSGPLRTETARLRKLTANRKRQPHEFDMVSGIRDMVQARRQTGVTIDLRAPTSAQILGEESEVMAIVDNLLSNAMRHGADPVRIAIEEHNGHVQVRVTDSGRITDPAQTSSFFKRGFTSHSEGEGIGLDRARMLAELHNGTVVYEPGDDGETSFVLTLPNSDTAETKGDPKVVSWSPVGR